MSGETLAPVTPAYDPLLDLVVSNGIIDLEQADELRGDQANTGRPIRQLLVDNGFVSENDLRNDGAYQDAMSLTSRLWL